MTIRTEAGDGVLTITIDRPEARNALSREMSAELCAAWERLRDDAELRVAILTGAGDKAFCAGADIKEIGAYYRSMTPTERRRRGEHEPGLGGITRNLDPGKPIIAAINGACLAGGLEIAMACDIRICAEHATFGLPEVRRGIIPGAGGTQRLPRLVPLAMAMEMILTGQAIDAPSARSIGLVNRVVPLERLMDEARDVAGRIAANGPLAVQAARAAVLSGRHLALEEGIRIEQFHAEPVRQSEDAREGIEAFIEKRAPKFKGR